MSSAELKQLMNKKRAAREQDRIAKGETPTSVKIEELKKKRQQQQTGNTTNALLMNDEKEQPIAGYKRNIATKINKTEKIDTAVLDTAAQKRQAGIRNELVRSGFFDDPPPNTIPPGIIILEPFEEDAAKAYLASTAVAAPKPVAGLSSVTAVVSKNEMKMEVIRMQKELAEEKEKQLTSSTIIEAEKEWAESRTRDDAAASMEGQSVIDKYV